MSPEPENPKLIIIGRFSNDFSRPEEAVTRLAAQVMSMKDAYPQSHYTYHYLQYPPTIAGICKPALFRYRVLDARLSGIQTPYQYAMAQALTELPHPEGEGRKIEFDELVNIKRMFEEKEKSPQTTSQEDPFFTNDKRYWYAEMALLDQLNDPNGEFYLPTRYDCTDFSSGDKEDLKSKYYEGKYLLLGAQKAARERSAPRLDLLFIALDREASRRRYLAFAERETVQGYLVKRPFPTKEQQNQQGKVLILQRDAIDYQVTFGPLAKQRAEQITADYQFDESAFTTLLWDRLLINHIFKPKEKPADQELLTGFASKLLNDKMMKTPHYERTLIVELINESLKGITPDEAWRLCDILCSAQEPELAQDFIVSGTVPVNI